MSRPRPWEFAEDVAARWALREGMSFKVIGWGLGRTASAVRMRLSRIGYQSPRDATAIIAPALVQPTEGLAA